MIGGLALLGPLQGAIEAEGLAYGGDFVRVDTGGAALCTGEAEAAVEAQDTGSGVGAAAANLDGQKSQDVNPRRTAPNRPSQRRPCAQSAQVIPAGRLRSAA